MTTYNHSNATWLNNRPNLYADSRFSNITAFQFPTLILSGTYLCFVLLIVALLLYIETLLAFIHRRTLITPFNIHIINLTIINLLSTVAYNPILLTRNLHREFFRGNYVLCTSYKYIQWTMTSMCAMQHVVICIDRWVAVLWPLWYRTKTVKFGFIATFSCLVYQQLWFLPIFIQETTFKIAPGELCDVTQAFRGYQQVARAAQLIAPEVFLFISYPILLYKIFRRTKSRVVQQPVVDFGPILNDETDGTLEVTVHRNGPRQGYMVKTSQKSRNELHLALFLVVSQIVFWIPQTINSIMTNLRLTLPYQYDVGTFFTMLPIILLVTDPLVNLIFMRSLRREIVLHLKRMFALAALGRWQIQVSVELRSGPTSLAAGPAESAAKSFQI